MDKKRKILIVDDEEINRWILKNLFDKEFEILEAANGKEAIEQVKNNREDLEMLFLDIVMPVMNGFEVLKSMQRQGWLETIPVFLITAEESHKVINEAYDMGVVDVINKPFNPTIILRRAYNTMELYKNRFNMEQQIREQTRKLKEQSELLRQRSLAMVDALSTVVEFRDCESGQHIKRIRGITKVLLTAVNTEKPEYNFTVDQIDEISQASVMHDVGKIAIPDTILNKPGRLTEAEFEIMKTHTVRGCEIMDSVEYIHDNVSYRYYYDICRWHHEKWDGRGYPDGLKGDDIPIWSQVVAVADCYDALVSERVYKPAYSHEQAIRMILAGECGQFNPLLLNCFRLSSGELEEINRKNR